MKEKIRNDIIRLIKEMTYKITGEYKLEDDDRIWVENELSKMGVVKMMMVAQKLKSPVYFKKPDKAEMFINKGNLYLSRYENHNAIIYYNKAIKANPNSYRAYDFRGLAKIFLADYQGAILDCSKAILINPNYKEALKDRAEAKKCVGDLKGALEDLNKFIDIDPDYADAYYLRGEVLMQMGEKEKALSDYKIAKDKKRSHLIEKYQK